MSDAWGRVADRGRLDLHVKTRARCEAEGVSVLPGIGFLMLLLPDDYEPSAAFTESLALLREFVREMAPRTVTVDCAEGEDAAELLAAIEAGRDGALVQ